MPRGPFRLPEGEMPLNMERGGSVCDSSGAGRTGHMLQGSGGAAVCMPTLGNDSRSRWRRAGGVTSGSQLVSRRASRHTSYSDMQARGATGSARRASGQ